MRVRGVLRVRRETALGFVCLSHPQAPFKQVHPPVIMLSLRLRTVSASLWVANYYSARNPLRLSSLVILGVVARMFRCATRSSCWCT